MKIDLSGILKAHWLTLRDVGKDHVSYWDVFWFFGIPILVGVLAFYINVRFSQDVFSVSISVFAIFSALLLSVQVAMYGVFRAARKEISDPVLSQESKKRAEDARILLREVNTNVSYLIFVSCLAVSVFLLFFAVSLPCKLEASISITLYVHFLLTVAMVLKRAHEVFDSEYSDPIA